VVESQDPFKNSDYLEDNAAIDTDVREQLGHETVEAEVKSLQRRLKLVEKALRKMEKGTYGLDAKSGEPISFERLKIMPEAEHTIANEKRLVR
jgi:RNA polymerase-binding transcription factor DksA